MYCPRGFKPEQKLCWKPPLSKTSVFCPLPDCPSLLLYWTKTCLKKFKCKRGAEAHSLGSVHEMEHWFNRKAFTCSFSSFWSTSLFKTIHHQAHKPLPQQLKSHSFCPSWWEETLSCNMVKIFQVFYHSEQDHRKTPHNFFSFSTESLQLYYADLLCISL